MIRILLSAILLFAAPAFAQTTGLLHSFKKVRATDQFWAEGAAIGDFNHDGKMDIVSGAYSYCFLTFAYDFNDDGWTDVLVYGFPGKEAAWYENPKGRPGHWQRHVILDVLDNESPGFTDSTGDGKPELLCCSGGYIGYAEADWKNPGAPWKFHPISPKGDYQKFTHGIGSGDINGDGRIDIIEKDGWWEKTASLANDPVWIKHPFHFAAAAAQMLVYDVNGDGLNEIGRASC